MSSEATITEKLILQACDDLAKEGVRVTNESVRTRLALMTSTKGGSYATIGPVVRAWNERRKTAAAASGAREPAPQIVLDKLHAWSSDLWAAALKLADDRLAAERDALDRARAELEGEAAEALDLAERREAERDEARRAAAAESDQLRASLRAAQAEAGDQAARAAAAEARATEIAVRVEDLQARLQREESSHKSVSDELTMTRSVIARLEQQSEDQSRQLAAAVDDLNKARSALESERDRAREELAGERRRMESAVDELKRDLASARQETLESTTQLARAGGRVEVLEAQLVRLQSAEPKAPTKQK
ncbi:DNA-binding protein [Acidovorax sp. SUPP950]|uniref:DNA-binding protein n=1 Tax=Acidovorax sp. SUPP950 TaxID=511901 RepID=UPI0023C8806B|nr:DNA-binding protein [Acidovorax sp. SUPP950]GKS73288.1 DNA-binding protein [Acidovorax sp. SUPP950]